MPPLKLGFALEGNSDYPVIPVLARRVIQDKFADLPLDNDSVLRPRWRGHGFIKELPRLSSNYVMIALTSLLLWWILMIL